MMTTIAGQGSRFVSLYRLYAAFLNIMAPVAGGAIIFDLLSEFFPKFRLWFNIKFSRKDRYYFSKLNERSFALAKSIIRCENSRPIIVFCDVKRYGDDESNSELYQSAKSIDAFCVNNDLLSLNIGKDGVGAAWLTRQQPHQLYPFSLPQGVGFLVAVVGDKGDAAGTDGFKAAVLGGADKDVLGLGGKDSLDIEVAFLADAHGASVAHLLLHGGREEVLQRIHAHDTLLQPQHLKVSQLEGGGTDKASEGMSDDYLLWRAIGCGRVGVADDDVDAIIAVIDLQSTSITYPDGIAEGIGMSQHGVVGCK